jgi:hypothetical protein
MASVNFESRSPRGAKGGPSSSNTGVNTTGIPGWNFDRVVFVTPALATILKVPTGEYEHVGEDASGNWTYALCTRNNAY